MSDADFPKDEDVVACSARACQRLVDALDALGVCPAEKVNPLDAAAFMLEALVESRDSINATARKTTAGLEEFDSQVASLTGDGEPTDEDLEEVHESGCAILDNQEEVDAVCTCGQGEEQYE